VSVQTVIFIPAAEAKLETQGVYELQSNKYKLH